MAKKKEIISQEELDRLVNEKRKEYLESITPVVKIANGNIWIKNISLMHDEIFDRLRNLLSLLNIEFATHCDVSQTENCYPRKAIDLILPVGDPDLAAYIQRFINNGYVLDWRKTHE